MTGEPFYRGSTQSEVDLQLGDLLIDAKLTENARV
jgi:hypothetical protein